MATEAEVYPAPNRQNPMELDAMLMTAELDEEALIRDLLGTDGDLLSSLLSTELEPVQPPYTCTSALPADCSTSFDVNTLSLQQSSPIASEGCASDVSSTGKAQSPSWSTHSSDTHPMNPHPQLDQQELMRLGLFSDFEQDFQTVNCVEQQETVSSPSSSGGDVHIDFGDLHVPSLRSSEQLESTSSEWKTGGTVITEEERRLLVEEGIFLPTDMPLTKTEEKQLKRVRRKIKNKISAAESRRRKKDYVDGLEHRVEKCTKLNRSLQERVNTLEIQNRSLHTQLKRLQAWVAQCNPTKARTGSCIMVLLLSFSLLMVHNIHFPGQSNSGLILSTRSTSRTLLEVVADEFGNLVDPETRQVISAAGGQSPVPPPPWKCQTPAVEFWNTRQ